MEIIKRLPEYWTSSLQLAQVHKLGLPTVLWKVLVARARHGVGMDFIRVYQLVTKPTIGYGDYMRHADLERALNALSSDDQKNETQDKLRFYSACVDRGLSTPTILGCLRRPAGSSDSQAGPNPALDEVPVVADGAQLLRLLRRHLASAGHDQFVFKPADGGHGDGIERFALTGAGLAGVGGEPVKADALVERLRSAADTYIVQPALRPHASLAALMPQGGLGTFRVVTFKHGDDVRVPYVVLKIPTGNAFVDNFAAGKGGNFAAEVCLETSTLKRCCGPSDRYPEIIEPKHTHPDSGIGLIGFHLTHLDEVIELARAAARVFDPPGTLGWDIAMTEEGPSLIEGNWRWGVEIIQATGHRGVKTELNARLEALARQSAPSSSAPTSSRPQ